MGTGLNTYGAATLFYQTVEPTTHFAEAHNDYLQLLEPFSPPRSGRLQPACGGPPKGGHYTLVKTALAEGGALVCIPAALVVLAFAWTVHRRFREVSVEGSDYWIRIGAVTGILAIALQETSDFSLQMPGNAVLFTVLLAIAVRSSQSEGGVRLQPDHASIRAGL